MRPAARANPEVGALDAVPASGRALRAWQQRALALYTQSSPRDFLVTATPGSGKTTFALALARRLLDTRQVDRVVVVCPTDHLRTQWALAAAAVGIDLDPALPNSVGPVRPGLAGYVTTYAQVAGRRLLHRARTSARRSLVVLDEVHHAGDGLTWGDAVEEAFEPARRRLSLTGTPFRTRPDERIPFVRYEADTSGPGEGLRSLADYGYSYRDALTDGVVRPVVFAAYTGVSRWRNNAGQVVAASLTEQLTRVAEAQAWRTALDPKGQWVPHVIAAMDDRLTQLRFGGMPDAAGIVLASDQDTARAYARIVTRVTGVKPALILSDDPKASERLHRFGSSDERIAVCVRMISEGVDVPRAACLAWLTSYRTPLFFAQAVGRVVRARRPGESATVFLPAVRPLLALAAELEQERNHVVSVRSGTDGAAGDELLDPLPPGERVVGGLGGFEALEAQAEFAHVLHEGRAVLAGRPQAARPDEAGGDEALGDEALGLLGLPGLLSPEQTATLLAGRDDEIRRRAASGVPQLSTPAGPGAGAPPRQGEPEAEPKPERGTAGTAWRAAALRREVNALVGRVAARTGTPHAMVHARLRAAVPGPGSATATVEVLERRRDHLLSQT